MGIMESMRSGSDSAWMQLVMAAVVVSFVMWYGQPNSGQKGGNIATVNGQAIPDTEFRRSYRDAERTREYRENRILTDAEKQFLAEEIKNQLVREEVVVQEAYRLGLEVSDYEVGKFLFDFPAFRDENNAFDKEMMERWLKRRRTTRADFEARVRRQLLAQKLQTLMYMGATISEPAVRDIYVDENTKLDIAYVRVRSSAFYDTIDISAEDASAWVTENAEKVKEIYERDFDRLYNHPEQLDLSMILLPIRQDGQGAAELIPRLRTIREEIEAGADFAEMARKWSEDPSAEAGGALGLVKVTELDPEVGTSLEKTEVGALSEVVATERDVRLYFLASRQESHADPLEDVQNQIGETALRQERAPGVAAGVAEALLAAWTESGEAPQALLDEHSLNRMTTGLILAKGGPLSFNAPPASLMKVAKRAEQGAVLGEVFSEGGVLWVAQLVNRQDADMARYELEVDEIKADALTTRRDQFFTAWRDDLVAQATVEIY